MKLSIALLPCLMLLSMPALAQKKGKVDSKQVTIDSLLAVNTAMVTRLDSMYKEEAKYHGVYTAVKEKVLKHDFAPERTGELIDSLKAGREKTFSTLTADTKALNDSVATLSAENIRLKAKVTTLETAAANKEVVIADLRELKGLLDEKIITQEEFDARKAKIMKNW